MNEISLPGDYEWSNITISFNYHISRKCRLSVIYTSKLTRNQSIIVNMLSESLFGLEQNIKKFSHSNNHYVIINRLQLI
jgi:hypothetical protein